MHQCCSLKHDKCFCCVHLQENLVKCSVIIFNSITLSFLKEYSIKFKDLGNSNLISWFQMLWQISQQKDFNFSLTFNIRNKTLNTVVNTFLTAYLPASYGDRYWNHSQTSTEGLHNLFSSICLTLKEIEPRSILLICLFIINILKFRGIRWDS